MVEREPACSQSSLINTSCNFLFWLMKYLALACLLSICLAGTLKAQAAPRADTTHRTYQVILLGNTGADRPSAVAPTLQLLRRQLATMGENSAVVLLGDLLPCCGMPDSGTADRRAAEERLMTLVNVVQDFDGRVIVIPGERDWGKDRTVGWESLIQIEQFFETALNRDDVFYPTEGFPGPEHIRLTGDIRLLAANAPTSQEGGRRLLHRARGPDR